MSTSKCLLLLLAALLLTTAPCLAGVVYTFEDVPGRATPFSSTVGGITATFSSPDGPVFSVNPFPVFSGLQGNILFSDDSGNHTLAVAFSQPLASITMNFALGNTTGGFFTLDTFLGGASVAETQVFAGPPPDFVFSEGVIGFSGGIFDTIRLSTPSAPDFAIDNLAVQASVPEPSTFGAGMIAIGGLLAIRRRLRRHTPRAS